MLTKSLGGFPCPWTNNGGQSGAVRVYVPVVGCAVVFSLSEQHAPGAENTAAGLISRGNLGGAVLATVIGPFVTRPVIAARPRRPVQTSDGQG